ncbi:ABC transporter permease [Halopenitus persicus]|uniref:ABC transporter permease n=1 Tax=Halopenitus persicus TaxID=1048396 RepID=UPI001E468DC6|nr:ABC transporter permease [Halopenitus persicus]
MSVANRSRQVIESGAEYVREHRRARLGLLVGIPASVLVAFFILPLLTMAWMSFLSDMPPAPLTLEHYIRIFTGDTYITVLWRTAVLTVQSTIIVVVLGYVLAYSIARFSKRATIVLLLIILPFWTNYIVRMYALINIFQSGGVLDTVMILVGLASEPSGIMYSHTAVLIGLAYVWLPLATFPFYASLTNMDGDLIDASKDLGAGPIKTFLRVTLPMTKNGVIAGIVLVAIPAFGSFITPALLGGTNVLMVGMVIEQQFAASFNWPFGSALGMVVTVGVVLLIGLGSWLGAGGKLAGGGDE